MSGFMPIGDFRVTYRDGSSVVVASNFAGLVEIERRWPGRDEVPAITALAIATWHYLDCPGELDEWMKTVHLIEGVDLTEPAEGDDEPAVPTEPAVGVA